MSICAGWKSDLFYSLCSKNGFISHRGIQCSHDKIVHITRLIKLRFFKLPARNSFSLGDTCTNLGGQLSAFLCSACRTVVIVRGKIERSNPSSASLGAVLDMAHFSFVHIGDKGIPGSGCLDLLRRSECFRIGLLAYSLKCPGAVKSGDTHPLNSTEKIIPDAVNDPVIQFASFRYFCGHDNIVFCCNNLFCHFHTDSFVIALRLLDNGADCLQ